MMGMSWNRDKYYELSFSKWLANYFEYGSNLLNLVTRDE